MSDFHVPSINPSLVLRNRYVLALSLIALLIIASQIVIQLTIARNDDDARVVNVAGRQRMLSQKIAKASLQILAASDTAGRIAPQQDLYGDVMMFGGTHEGLLAGSPTLGVYGRNSDEILALFAEVEPSFRELLDAASTLRARATAPGVSHEELEALNARILAVEDDYLRGMDAITDRYEFETTERLGRIRALEYILLGLTALTLALEALFIFLPAERQIGRYFREMKRAVEILNERATWDGLTGLYNRATGLLLLDREIEKARRDRSDLALCFLDLDGLKAVNDHYGHDEGDRSIALFAAAIKASIRAEDAAFRYGGDEFVLVLDCGLEGARRTAERLRAQVAAANARLEGPWRLSFSVGFAGFRPESGTSSADLLAEADAEMYRDKLSRRAGRPPSG